ncbi:MAG: hypothetical protein LIQ31_14085 [Planctomycetes bacterium]|nr:hypothetical protein [Planctomycetota bacterium]
MKKRNPLRYAIAICLAACIGVAVQGDATAMAGEVPYAELQALDRAIERELGRPELGSQTLGDLQRLRHRLGNLRSGLSADRVVALEPLSPVASPDNLDRLEAEAATGSRSAQRSLALYHLFMNQPEQALQTWRGMGRANQTDVAFLLMSAYMELAVGEHTIAAGHIEEASRLLATRTSLELSTPIFATNIAGYRLYEERTGGDLLPGEDTLLYVEVDGADFFATSDGGYECRIMFGISLRNEAGAVVFSEPNYGEYAPFFNGPIRDLHTALVWRVPNNLVSGLYTLRVEAVEQSSKRRGESELEFTVGQRSTNPTPRPGDTLPPVYNKAIQDAGRAFPGAPMPSLPPPTWTPADSLINSIPRRTAASDFYGPMPGPTNCCSSNYAMNEWRTGNAHSTGG